MKLLLSSLYSILTASVLFSQTISNDTMHWSESKKLAWTDFKGKEIKGSEKSQQSLMAMLASYAIGNPLKPTSTTVVAVFDRKKSWISKEAQTAQELKYYQVMFDIYELHSRKLRKEFKETKLGLDPNKLFQEKYSLAIAELDEHVREFNEETKSGAAAGALGKWEEEIKKELKELDEFKKSIK